jgi:hypothetical protein
MNQQHAESRRLPCRCALTLSSALGLKETVIFIMANRAPPQNLRDLVELTSERRLRNIFESRWMMMCDFAGNA